MKVGTENEKLEFKKTTAELKEGVISMAAILNKHGGGELYFGVQNDGTPVGQVVGANTLRDVSQAVSNHLEPKVYPKISEAVINNKRCIHVQFLGDRSPYLAYGRAYIRVADEDKQMSSAELEDYILRKHAGKDSWDSEASYKTIDDIDEDVLRSYIERANNVGRIDFKYTTKEDALKRLDLLKDGKLKNAAAVWFCGESLLELQMAIFATPERFTFLDINRSGGNIMRMMDIAEKYIGINIRYRVEFDGSLQRNEIPEIPMDAVREAIVNSYCHRDYKSSQNNEVIIYSDRVEIYNPGTFPLGFTPQDFIDGKGSSVKRNPLLAQLMYYVKDIESFGTGIRRISNECEADGVRVAFEIRQLGFAVIFYRPENHTVSDIRIGDKIGDKVGENEGKFGENEGKFGENKEKFGENEGEFGEKFGENEGEFGENKNHSKILRIMHNNPTVSAKAIANEIGLSARGVEKNIRELKKAGLLERVGPDKGGYWVVRLLNTPEQ